MLSVREFLSLHCTQDKALSWTKTVDAGTSCRCHLSSFRSTRLCLPRTTRWQLQRTVRPFQPSKMPEQRTAASQQASAHVVHAQKQKSTEVPQLKSSLLLTDVAGQTIRCHVFKPQSSNAKSTNASARPQGPGAGEQMDPSATSKRASEEASKRSSSSSSGTAVLLLSDIFGCDTTDNLKMCQRLSNDLQCPVYMPDLFRGEPWPEQTPVTADEFEAWRANIGGAPRLLLTHSLDPPSAITPLKQCHVHISPLLAATFRLRCTVCCLYPTPELVLFCFWAPVLAHPDHGHSTPVRCRGAVTINLAAAE